MKYTPNYNVNPLEKLLIYCEGMRSGFWGYLFKTPVIITNEFVEWADGVKIDDLGVRCKEMNAKGECMKNESKIRCYLLEKARRA